MKGDFTRNTFNPRKHYGQVRLQQGRPLADADWNEQTELTAHRSATTVADLAGDCGGPANDAAFGLLVSPATLSDADYAALRAWVLLRGGPDLGANKLTAQLDVDDFILTRGRYYVDGIQCELEHPVLFSRQPDRPARDLWAAAENLTGPYAIVILDVWQRHLTALEDGSIREAALGGPDTATRVKTVWQVRVLNVRALDAGNPCGTANAALGLWRDPGTARLTADTLAETPETDPCLVPAGAGYTGLENQLYRVEIHDAGGAIKADTTVASTTATLETASNQITVTSLNIGGRNLVVNDPVEIFAGKAGTPVMNGQLAWITKIDARTLTLNSSLKDLVQDDQPRVRRPAATWKWSRENGSVVTPIEKIDGRKITVSSLGPDANLGFGQDAWVEILDDALELEGLPGQMVRIESVNQNTRVITLRTAASPLATGGGAAGGIAVDRHPKLRRWEGVAAVKFVDAAAMNWANLENGVRVAFGSSGEYRTGHYWQIPARAATARSPKGDIEWARENPDNPATPRLALAPRGIEHHYCRLGVVSVGTGAAPVDCRCLWPDLTSVPQLFYVSGDGQEVMPDLVAGTEIMLAKPLIVGVANGQCLNRPVFVRYSVSAGGGQVGGETAGAGAGAWIDVPIAPDGMARCRFFLRVGPMGTLEPVQEVTARLLDAAGEKVSLPVIFNARLSIASQVAYDPAGCEGLSATRTVQAAIARLASSVRLEKFSGDGQDGDPGTELSLPIRVAVMSKCGPVADAVVTFTPSSGGAVTATKDEGNGLYSCLWTLDADMATQELTAELELVAGSPAPLIEMPNAVRFTANLRTGGHGVSCCVTVGPGGDFPSLEEALRKLAGRTAEICLCLLPGDHRTERPLKPKTEGEFQTHLKISGCGPNTRLTLGGNIHFVQFGSVIIRDLLINAHRFMIGFVECGAVEVRGCQIFGLTAKSPLLEVQAVTRVDFSDNHIEALSEGVEISSTTVFRSVPDLAKLFAAPSDPSFGAQLARIAERLARSDLAARKKLIDAIQKVLRDTGDLGEATPAYRRVLNAVAGGRVETLELVHALQALRDAIVRAAGGFALLQGNMDSAVTLLDNRLYGTISIGGEPFRRPLTKPELGRLSLLLKANDGQPLVESPGVLQMHRCDFTRMTVGQDVIEALRSLAVGEAKSVAVWQAVFLSHNLIRGNGHFVVAGNLSVTSNRFCSPNDPLGLSINGAAHYVYNRGENSYDIGYMNLSAFDLVKEPNSRFKVTEM